MTADAKKVGAGFDLEIGDFTVYAMTKSKVITTWYLNDKDIRSREKTPVKWSSGPTLDSYRGEAVAAMTSDQSKAGALWVATDGFKHVSGFKQSPTPKQGKAREWSVEVDVLKMD